MTTTHATPAATGHKEVRDGEPHVVFTRTFSAPIDDVWAAVTDSDRLARWIGSWTGDPAEGHVEFRMLFEGDGHAAERFTIDECDRPSRLAITSAAPSPDGTTQIWHFLLDLVEDGGVTTFTFSQSVPEPAMAEGVGPGWDYYLDRMVAAETDGDVAAIDFDDYYPALTDHYRAEFS
jgi:uncharacterized protein YndB with AHSA1/START domain